MSQLAPTRSRKRKHSETQPPPTNTTNPSSKIEESHDGPHEPATTKGARSNPKDVEAAYPAEPNDRESELPEAQGQKPKSQRFIVFIGNLPYTATDDSIKRHFAKVQPSSIRHRTQRDSSTSKGFAFLEFDRFDRMKTCLKLYHHSSFDDGRSPARRLNVELTVGGGGSKSKGRKDKIQAKNGKLNEERRRRGQEEAKHGKKALATDQGEETSRAPAENVDVHPSRRSRVQLV